MLSSKHSKAVSISPFRRSLPVDPKRMYLARILASNGVVVKPSKSKELTRRDLEYTFVMLAINAENRKDGVIILST